MNDGLRDLVELERTRAPTAEGGLERRAQPLASFLYAGAGHLGPRVGGEKLRGLIPQVLVGVVALGHSITYRVAVGPRAGQKVFALQSVPAREEEPRKGVAQYAGFSLHAGVGVQAEQRDKLERLARYVSRPPVSVERLDLTAQGRCATG